jgi:hypothetical protein
MTGAIASMTEPCDSIGDRDSGRPLSESQRRITKVRGCGDLRSRAGIEPCRGAGDPRCGGTSSVRQNKEQRRIVEPNKRIGGALVLLRSQAVSSGAAGAPEGSIMAPRTTWPRRPRAFCCLSRRAVPRHGSTSVTQAKRHDRPLWCPKRANLVPPGFRLTMRFVGRRRAPSGFHNRRPVCAFCLQRSAFGARLGAAKGATKGGLGGHGGAAAEIEDRDPAGPLGVPRSASERGRTADRCPQRSEISLPSLFPLQIRVSRAHGWAARGTLMSPMAAAPRNDRRHRPGPFGVRSWPAKGGCALLCP